MDGWRILLPRVSGFIQLFRVIRLTYKDDDEIKYCPKAAKILCKSQRDPLEEHLNDKDQAES